MMHGQKNSKSCNKCFYDKLLSLMWDNGNQNHIYYFYHVCLSFVHIDPYYYKQNIIMKKYIEIKELKF